MIEKFRHIRNTKQWKEDTQKALQELNKLDIENIGMINGTEFARRLKLLTERFSKEQYKFFDMPEFVCLICELIKYMPQYKKEPEMKIEGMGENNG